MNVNDVAPPSPPASGVTAAEQILARQNELEDSYWKIEGRPCKLLEFDVREHQTIMKDFCWRITEELGEAFEAIDNKESPEKVFEELADAMHFVAGLAIITQTTIEFVTMYKDRWRKYMDGDGQIFTPPASVMARQVVRDLSIFANHLKLKPWKQSDILTDRKSAKIALRDFYDTYLRAMISMGLDPMLLHSFYMRKSEVNLFRIRSRY